MTKDRVTVLDGGSMLGEKSLVKVRNQDVFMEYLICHQIIQINYTNQPNAWMNRFIFCDYLNKLDNRLLQLLPPNTRALVVVDNCTGQSEVAFQSSRISKL